MYSLLIDVTIEPQLQRRLFGVIYLKKKTRFQEKYIIANKDIHLAKKLRAFRFF